MLITDIRHYLKHAYWIISQQWCKVYTNHNSSKTLIFELCRNLITSYWRTLSWNCWEFVIFNRKSFKSSKEATSRNLKIININLFWENQEFNQFQNNVNGKLSCNLSNHRPRPLIFTRIVSFKIGTTFS